MPDTLPLIVQIPWNIVQECLYDHPELHPELLTRTLASNDPHPPQEETPAPVDAPTGAP